MSDTTRTVRLLGIETSCDETSAAVVRGVQHAGASGQTTLEQATLESLVILSQDVHRLFGGVVPEIASRQHLTGIVPAVDR
jgi:N6-L-threonylcarbamoyladenine synthase